MNFNAGTSFLWSWTGSLTSMLMTVGTPVDMVTSFSFSQSGNLERENFLAKIKVAPVTILDKIVNNCGDAQLYVRYSKILSASEMDSLSMTSFTI